MRYVLAIVALAISGVFLLLGIGQRTFLAGPSEIVYSVGADETASYAVLDVSELAKVEGQANIVMRGETSFSALANTRDAEAWLEPFDHVELTVDPATKKVVRTPVKGTAPTVDILETDDEGNAVPLDPRGSDLWLEEHNGADGATRMAVEAVGEQSIIIAGEEAGPIPKGTAIVWVQDRATPWAGPLLAAGGLFAALGAVLYLIAFDRDKRALGPRRGRKGPLLGVRNVFGGSPKRGKRGEGVDGTPKRGSLENTSDAAALGAGAAGAVAGAVAGEAGAGSTDTDAAGSSTAADAEEIVTAEVIDDDTDDDTDVDDGTDIVDVEAADDVGAAEIDIEDATIDDAPTTGTDSTEVDSNATEIDDEAAKKGDDHAE